jgi:hypothetical protein
MVKHKYIIEFVDMCDLVKEEVEELPKLEKHKFETKRDDDSSSFT